MFIRISKFVWMQMSEEDKKRVSENVARVNQREQAKAEGGNS